MKRSKLLLGLVLTAVTATVLWAAGPKTGAAAPAFTLTDIDGKKVSLSDYKGKYVVLEWVNYGCPFVVKHYDTGNMQALQKEATGKGAVWLSICSSAEGKEGYLTTDEWKKESGDRKVNSTAILVDADGKVGRMYDAKTTPHMFIIDPKGNLIYKGAIDDQPNTKKDSVKGAKNYVRNALNEAMAGQTVSEKSTEAYGCSVKYKS